MSIGRWMDKEVVVHIHNGIFSSVTQLCLTLQPHESQHARPPCPSPIPGVLLSYKKECFWVSSNEVDETGPIIQSETSERETPISERGEWKSWLKAQHSENEDHGIWTHHFMGNRWGNCQTLFWGAPKSLQMVTAAMKLKDAYSLEEKLWPT